MLFLSNREISKLDRTITEIPLRKLFFSQVEKFYQNNLILSKGELDWILSRSINLTSCHLFFDYHSKLTKQITILCFNNILFYYYCVESVIGPLVLKYPDLKELSGFCIDDEDLLSLAMHIGSKLTLFDFHDAYVTDRGLSGFCKKCPSIKHFRLEGGWRDVPDYLDEEEVGEDSVKALTDASVQALTENCTALENIALIDWTRITDQSMSYLSSITTLTHLKLRGCRKLTTAGVMRVIQANPGLPHIDLADFFQTENFNAFVSSIGSTCPALISLKLSFRVPNKVATESMLTLVKSCSLVEELDLKGFTQNDDYLVALSSSCPLLEVVHPGWK